MKKLWTDRRSFERKSWGGVVKEIRVRKGEEGGKNDDDLNLKVLVVVDSEMHVYIHTHIHIYTCMHA